MFRRLPVPVMSVFMLLLIMGQPSALRAVELQKSENDHVIIPDKASKEIKIDGELSEAVWQLPAIDREFKTIFPSRGAPFPQQTKIWAAYDKRNLYFAFKCLDTEPRKIKTSIAQRDNISRDDQVVILLDASGNRQTSYQFGINPNGIQSDAVNSAVSVDGADKSPDFVWESAAKITADGYQVEVRIPLESIRFQAGKTVKMGVVFTRQVSRLGTEAAWPEVPAGQTTFNAMATLVYKDLKGALKMEVLPNFTFGSNSRRESPDNWTKETDTNVGVALKYGITSSITAEATVNPDFSQVESDAFQVEVNQRFPIFFSEKRPFFMESKEVLDFGVVKWGLMPAPIHTRSIVDPGWAGKFSGSSGKLNFAVLAANDRSPGRARASGSNPNEGKTAFFGVVRAKYNLGSDNSIGMLYSGRHFAGESNNVVGTDLKYRFSKNLRGSASYLRSFTRDYDGGPTDGGNSVNAMMQYNTSNFFGLASYELYDRNFNMATAFLIRSGVGKLLAGAGPSFDMKVKSMPWLKRISPYVYYIRTHDLETKMNDITRLYGVVISLAPMGEFNFEYYDEDEAWAGELFRKNYFFGLAQIQLAKWLHLNGTVVLGDAIFYDPETPFLGDGHSYSFGATVQPGIKLKLGFEYVYTDLSPKGSSENVFSVNIYNLQTTYQFNKYFFVRGIMRYNDFQEKLLTDFLASFTLIPGTVVHLGYGSVYEKTQWRDNRWSYGVGELREMRRGLFFKASYLWRID
ncbi:MAG: carbohydrate binding family 9 domain-containing protein [bacterium]|nr:carbohydrate binding family 9 domain-containing protein [bacterium]